MKTTLSLSINISKVRMLSSYGFMKKCLLLLLFAGIAQILFGQLTSRPSMKLTGQYDIKMVGSVALQPAIVSSANGAPYVVDKIINQAMLDQTGDLININNNYGAAAAGNTVETVAFPNNVYAGLPITDPALPYSIKVPCGNTGEMKYSTTNRNVALVYADCDDDMSTWQSSAAYCDFGTNMSCTTIEHAYLYWTGNDDALTTNYAAYPGLPTMKSHAGGATGKMAGYKSIKFKAPGDAAYTDIDADSVRVLPCDPAASCGDRYVCFRDVTSLVKGKLGGMFWVANICTSSADPGGGAISGWNLVVVFTPPNCPPRVINFWDGIQNIDVGDTEPITLSLVGSVPASSNFTSYLGIAVLDGENLATEITTPETIDFKSNGTGAVTASINPFATDQIGYRFATKNGAPTVTSGPLQYEDACGLTTFEGIPWKLGIDGVSSSHITSYDPVTNTNGNEIIRIPQNRNTLGLDAHHMRLPQTAIAPNTTSVTMTYKAGSQGGTSPFMAYVAIETQQPRLVFSKSVVGSTTTSTGSTVTYKFVVKNIGNAPSNAGAYILDTLDLPIDYATTSVVFKDKTLAVIPLDAAPSAPSVTFTNAGTDVDEVGKFYLPILAAANAAGVPQDSVTITFDATVKPLLSPIWSTGCRRVIHNKATAYYTDLTSKPMSTGSNAASGCPGAGVDADIAVVDAALETAFNLKYNKTFDITSTPTANIQTRVYTDLQGQGVAAGDVSKYTIYDIGSNPVPSTQNFSAAYPTEVYVATYDIGYGCVETYTFTYEKAITPQILPNPTWTDNVCTGDPTGTITAVVERCDAGVYCHMLKSTDMTSPVFIGSIPALEVTGAGTKTFTANGLAGGKYYIQLVSPQGEIQDIDSVTIAEPNPLTLTVNGVSPICSGATANLTTTVSGGLATHNWVWKSSTDSTTWTTMSSTVDNASQASLAATTYFKAYACDGGCSVSAVKKIVVNNVPTVPAITAPAALCVGGSLNTTAPTVVANGSAITAEGWQLEDAVSAGTYTNLAVPYTVAFADNGKKIRYYATNACGTTYNTGVLVTVNNVPTVPAITAPAALCVGGSLNPTAPTVVANGSAITAEGWQLEDAVSGGTYTNLAVPYTVALTDNGKKIRYYATNTCGTTYNTGVLVTVNNVPTVPAITAPAALCVGGSLNPTAPTVVANGSAISAQGWQMEDAVSAGTYTNLAVPYTVAFADNGKNIRYYATNSCGTIYNTGVLVTVNNVPTVPAVTAPAALCVGGSLNPTAPTVVANGSAITAEAWQLEDAVSAGTYTNLAVPYTVAFADNGKKIRYYATNSCGTIYNTGVLVTVNNVPTVPAITAPAALCVGGSLNPTAPTVVANGSAISAQGWQLEDAVSAGTYTNLAVPYTVALADNGKNIRYYATNACGTTYNTAVLVTVNNVPTVPAITAPATICVGGSLNPTAPTVVANGSAISAQGWQLEDAVSAGTYTNIAVPYTLSSADNGKYIRYYASNTCGTIYNAGVLVTTSDVPTVPAITSPATMGVGGSLNPTAPTVVDNGSTITVEGWQMEATVGAGDYAALTVPYTVTVADDGKKIRYYATNSCGTTYNAGVVITVKGYPAIGSITIPALCNGASLNPSLPTVNDNGSAISAQGWELETSVASGVYAPLAVPYTVALADAGLKIRYYATNISGTSYSTDAVLTVNNVPTVPAITAPTALCAGGSLNPTAPTVVANGSAISAEGWQLEDAVSAGTYTNLAVPYTVAFADNGKNIRYYASNTCGTIYNTAVLVTVNDVPTVPAITAPAALCVGNSLNPTAPTVVANGSTISAQGWQLEDAVSAGTYTNLAVPYTLTFADNGKNIRYYATNTCSTIYNAGVLVTVNNVPTVPAVTAPAALCVGGSLNPTAPTVVANGSAISAEGWQMEDAVSAGTYTNLPVPYTVTFADNGKNIRYYATNACGTTYNTAVLVTVNNVPTVPAVTAPAALCVGGSLNPTAPTVVANGSVVTAEGWQLEDAVSAGTFTDLAVPYTVTFADNGKYIRYYATNTCGTTYNTAVLVTVNNVPTIPAISSPSALGIGGSLNPSTPAVVANGSTISAEGWELETAVGSGLYASISVPYTVALADDGKNIRYVATNFCGTSYSNEVPISVNGYPAIGAFTISALCVGGSLNPTAPTVNGNGSAVSAQGWEIETAFGSGLYTALAIPYTVSSTDNGLNVRYYATNISGTAYSSGVVIPVNSVPTVPAITSPSSLCVGASLNPTAPTVVANGAAISVEGWQMEDAVSAGTYTNLAVPYTVVFADNGKNIRYYATNTCGTIFNSGVPVTVTDVPSVPAITAPAALCAGGSLSPTAPTVVANGSAITAEAWQMEDAVSAGTYTNLAVPYTVSFADNGKNIRYYATNACGTTYNTGVLVTVNNVPTVPAITAPAALCAGGSLNPTAPTVVANGSLITAEGWQMEDAVSAGTYTNLTVPYTVAFADNGKKIRYYATNACGTTYNTAVAIAVNSVPTVPAITAPAALCVGGSLNPTAPVVVANGSAISAQGWQLENAVSAGIYTNLSVPYTLTLADHGKNIRYYATNTCGTIYNTAVLVSVNQVPTVPAILAPAALCDGGSLNPSAPTVVANGSAITVEGWQLENAVTSGIYTNLNVPYAVASTDNGKNIRYYATNACGTTYNSGVLVTVNPLPTVPNVSAPSALCVGGSLNPSNPTVVSNGFAVISQGWEIETAVGSGVYNTLSLPAIVAAADNGKNIRYYATNTCGTAYNTPVLVTVNSVPSVPAVLAPSALCVGGSLAITAPAVSANGATISIQSWQIENAVSSGVFVNLSLPYTVAFADNGKTIRYSATNVCGTTTNSAVAVTVNALPTVPAITAPAALCVGANLSPTAPTVVANGSTVTVEGWEMETAVGSGAYAAITLPYTVAFADHSKKIRYYATNTCGTSYSNAVSLTIKALPTASFLGNASICQDALSTVNVNLTGVAPWTFTWSDGTVSHPVTTSLSSYAIKETLASQKVYSISNVQDANCTAIAQGIGDPITVAVTQKPDIVLSSGSVIQSLCAGSQISPIAFDLIGGVTEVVPSTPWPTTIKTEFVGSSYVISGSVPQSLTIFFQAKGQCGLGTMKLVSLSVLPLPDVNLAVSPSRANGVCLGSDLQFNAELTSHIANEKVDYHWTTAQGTVVNNSPTYGFTPTTLAGSVPVNVYATRYDSTATTPMLCVGAVAAATGKVYDLPSKPRVANYEECALASGSGVVKWNDLVKINNGTAKWYVHGTNQAFIPRNVDKAAAIDTLADVKSSLTINNYTCESKEAAVVRIKVFENPQITRVIKSDLTNIQLEVQKGTLPYTYSVSGKSGQFDDIADMGIIPFGNQTVTVTDSNLCVSTVSFTLEAVPLVPDQYFTPNGDGVNDTWTVQNLQFYPNSEVFIHDRYGKELLKSKGDNFKGWDGIYQGNEMPGSDYWYIINIHETGKRLFGHFLLRR